MAPARAGSYIGVCALAALVLLSAAVDARNWVKDDILVVVRQRGILASNTNPAPRAPWGAQIMVYADGGKLLQPDAGGAAPTPAEIVPVGLYDTNIPDYAYAHVKSGEFRARGDKLYIHVKSPVYLAADNVTVRAAPIYQPVRLDSKEPHTAPNGDWDAVYPGWEVPLSPVVDRIGPYRSQIYVNPLNAVDYLAVGANDTLYLTAAVTDHTLAPADVRKYNVAPGVSVDDGYLAGQDLKLLNTNDEDIFVSSAYANPTMAGADDTGIFTSSVVTQTSTGQTVKTVPSCVDQVTTPGRQCPRRGSFNNTLDIQRVNFKTGAVTQAGTIQPIDTYGFQRLNKADALLQLPDGGFIVGTASTAGTRDFLTRFDRDLKRIGMLLYQQAQVEGPPPLGRPVNVIFADDAHTSMLVLSSNPGNTTGAFEVRRYSVAGDTANGYDGWATDNPRLIGTPFRSANPPGCPKPEQCTAVAILRKPNSPPAASCKDATLTVGAAGPVSVNASLIDAGSVDPDGEALTLTVAGGANLATVGVYPVTLTASDGTLTDTCTATVTVVAAPPAAVCKTAALTYTLDSKCRSPIIPARDLDAGSAAYGGVTLKSTVSPTRFSGVGARDITLTVTDSLNRTASCTVSAAGVDKELPKITCPFPTKRRVLSPTFASARATDNCSRGASLKLTSSGVTCSNASRRGYKGSKCSGSVRTGGGVTIKKAGAVGSSFSFRFSATDAAGNKAVTKTCKVTIVDFK